MRSRLRFDRGRSKKLATAWVFSRTGGALKAEFQCGYCRERKLYEQRNCRAHFPNLVQIGRKPKTWAPRIQRDKQTAPIRGYNMAECPTSYITPESAWLLELTDANGVVHRDAGATLFGPDSSMWPAWWVDALITVAGAKADYERAEVEAMQSK